MSIAFTWGTTTEERRQPFTCDKHLDRADAAYFRGVTVRAPATTVFQWLCQLRVAPYSHDWIDNLGRKSPPELTPGLENLAVGQRVMRVFELVDFEPGRHLTCLTKSRLFGHVAVTYMVVPSTEATCRLLAKVAVRYPWPPLGWMLRILLPWGDLVMMRRQLLNLKRLSERTTQANSRPT